MRKEEKIIFILCLAVMCWVAWMLLVNRADLIRKAELREAEFTKERNKLGELLVRADYQVVTLQELKRTQDSTLKEIIKEVGGLKKLVSVTKFTTNTHSTFITQVRDTMLKDSVKATVGDFTDPWLTFRAIQIGKKLHGSYSLKNDFTVTPYWDSKGLFKKKELSVLVKSKNPNTDITSIKPLVVQVPPKKWYETRLAAFGAGFASGVVLMLSK